MKRFVILFFVFLFLVTVQAETEQAIVFLKDTVDIGDIDLKPDFSNRAKIIKKIRDNFDQSQQSFMMNLNLRNVSVTDLLWSINALVVEYTEQSEIDQISQMAEVKKVLPDLLEYPEEPMEGNPVESTEDAFTYGLKNINVQRVWEELNITGAGVVVGVIDTGVDADHPDLDGKVINWYDDSGQSNPYDNHGHGSHCAGTIAGGNASGKHIGVAPDAKLVCARGIAAKGTRASGLLGAMEWMIDPDGNPSTHDFPRVVSCSWTSGYGDQNPYYAMLQRWLDLGMVPSFSAGNSGPSSSSITKPKEFPGCLASAAVDENKRVANFSSRGPAHYGGREIPKPDFASPGVDVYSVKTGGGYTTKSGTSMAAPHTSGIIALMLQAKPLLTVEDIRQILHQSAIDTGDTGYDYTYGYGLLDAYEAVSLALSAGYVSGTVRGPSGPVRAKITVVETGRTVYCNENGQYSIMLPEGSYTIDISMFGFQTARETVSVSEGDDVSLNVTLKDASKIKISGTIKAGDSGETIPDATVSVVGYDVKVKTDSSGDYELEIVGGSYALEASAFGYETVKIDEQSYDSDASVDFELPSLPPVLLVDDDLTKNYEQYYKSTLDVLGIEYNVHNVKNDGFLKAKDILPYHLLIWLTGSDTSTTLNAEEQSALKEYLTSGGNLLISGQDIGYDIKTDGFYEEFLHAKYKKDNSGHKELEGAGFSFSITGGDGADNQKYPEVIEAANGGKVLFSYTEGKGDAAVSYEGDYRLVYLGFGFEAVSTADNRKAIMQHLINFLYPDLDRQIDRILPLTRAIGDMLRERGISEIIRVRTVSDILSSYSRMVADEAQELPIEEKVRLLKKLNEMGLHGTVIHEALMN